MKNTILISMMIGLSAWAYAPATAQNKSIPEFLSEKQIWEEKLVVIYAPAERQDLIKEQLDALYTSINQFKKEKIVVVQIPATLSYVDRMYMKQKLRYRDDRLNVWVMDEKGGLRMSGTKVVSAPQLLRILDIKTRPEAVVRSQYFWRD